jgi:hypothetical protein
VFKAGLNNITKPYLLIFSKTKQNKTKQKRGLLREQRSRGLWFDASPGK